MLDNNEIDLILKNYLNLKNHKNIVINKTYGIKKNNFNDTVTREYNKLINTIKNKKFEKIIDFVNNLFLKNNYNNNDYLKFHNLKNNNKGIELEIIMNLKEIKNENLNKEELFNILNNNNLLKNYKFCNGLINII